jgi:hypothetical protein
MAGHFWDFSLQSSLRAGERERATSTTPAESTATIIS